MFENLIAFSESYPVPKWAAFIDSRMTDVSDRTSSYVHPVDRQVMHMLGSLPMQNAMKALINMYSDYVFHELSRNSILLNRRNYPTLFQVITHACNILGLALPQVYIRDDSSVYAFTAGTDDNCFVVATTGLLHALTETELSFVIGHECGHIQNRHIMFNNLANLLAKGGENIGCHSTPITLLIVPLQQILANSFTEWINSIELTADRAGLIICQDLQAAIESLKKVGGQMGAVSTIGGKNSISQIAKRIEHLQLFWSSQTYQVTVQGRNLK